MTTDQTIELAIPSHPIYLQLVRGMMERIGDILGLPSEEASRIILAVDEASSNIIKHAYMNEPGGRIEFLITLKQGVMDITITDFGKACDIRCLKPRALDDIRPGGLGVYIIGEVMDNVTYTCGENGRNRIRMTKTFSAS